MLIRAQLEQDQTVTSLTDSQVYWVHRIRNTGCGSERFDSQLSNATGDNYDLPGLPPSGSYQVMLEYALRAASAPLVGLQNP